MHNIFTKNRSVYSKRAQQLSMKAQILISECLDRRLIEQAREIQQIENELISLISNRKEEHPTTHYIWHTQGDDKVRASHAANNGKIFAWNNPPATGHPGEDFNCRCWAEPINKEEYMQQEVISIVDEGLNRWAWYDFVIHFYFGKGRTVELWQIGHLQDVIDVARTHVFKGVENQTAGKAREVIDGSFTDTFSNSYNFKPVSFVHGNSTVEGKIDGNTRKEGKSLIINAKVDYNFSDIFTDPLDIIEAITHTPRELDEFVELALLSISKETGISIDYIAEIYKQMPKYTIEDIHQWIKEFSEFGGTKFDIKGNWKTSLNGIVNENASESQYK
ncbi:phage minor head protein [Rickettsiales bacterium]|nr:phage minor head protein [Rickettsiales bacterium]